MSLKELDVFSFGDQNFGNWLSSISMPVVILVSSSNFNRIKCQEALQMLEEVSKRPEFNNNVMFFWFDADEYGNWCRMLSATRTPTIIIQKNGKEVARLSDSIGAGTIIQRLHIMTDPARNHPVV